MSEWCAKAVEYLAPQVLVIAGVGFITLGALVAIFIAAMRSKKMRNAALAALAQQQRSAADEQHRAQEAWAQEATRRNQIEAIQSLEVAVYGKLRSLRGAHVADSAKRTWSCPQIRIALSFPSPARDLLEAKLEEVARALRLQARSFAYTQVPWSSAAGYIEQYENWVNGLFQECDTLQEQREQLSLFDPATLERLHARAWCVWLDHLDWWETPAPSAHELVEEAMRESLSGYSRAVAQAAAWLMQPGSTFSQEAIDSYGRALAHWARHDALHTLRIWAGQGKLSDQEADIQDEAFLIGLEHRMVADIGSLYVATLSNKG